MVSDNEVYSPREIALAAGVSELQVLEALGRQAGDAPQYLLHDDAVRIGRALAKVGRTPFSAALPFSKGMKPIFAERLAWSGTIHGAFVATFLVIATSNLAPRAATIKAETSCRSDAARVSELARSWRRRGWRRLAAAAQAAEGDARGKTDAEQSHPGAR